MKTRSMRLLSLLMVFVLMLGMIPTAYATTDSGTELTEPTDVDTTGPPVTEQPTGTTTPIPTATPTAESPQVTPSADLEATSTPEVTMSPTLTPEAETTTTPDTTVEAATTPTPEATVTPTPTPVVTPEPTPTPTPTPTLPTLSAGMVDNLYPAEMLEPDPYGIALLAQGGIPDAMWDNSILRALAYTGFGVQTLKDNGWLYGAQYISGQLKNNAPYVLSGIGYNETGSPPGGDEMTAGSSVTGMVPNIAHFRSNGMVCATFVSYYLTNYLPNIEGVDTSAIYSTAKSKGGLAAVRTWRLALDQLASTAGSGVTKYTAASTAYANLVPGDVIVFNSDIHIAIYLGEYDLMSYGSSRGRYHFIAHVGNSRGPEISTAEYMADSTYKPSSPIAWYHLEFKTEPDPGVAKIVKQTNTGANRNGWQFNLYSNSACTQLVSGSPFTTNANGEISVSLTPGDYWAKEVTKNDTYWTCDTSVKKITVQENKTSTVTFTNTHRGKALLKKTTNTGANLSGWQINVYSDAACSTPVSGSPFTTNTNGEVSVTLNPGDYWCKEVAKSDTYWVNDTATKKVTVQAGKTATVTFNNTHQGKVLLKKATNTGANLSGWQIGVYTDSACTKPVSGSPFTTGTNGEISVNLAPGTYWCKEFAKDDPYWICDATTKQVTVEAGKTATVTFNNTHRGRVLMKKTTNTGEDLSGWEISVYSDSARQSLVSTVTTDANGEAIVLLAPGSYYALETGDANARSTNEYWTNDTETKPITITAGKDTTITFANTHHGKIVIEKSLKTDGTVKDWKFKVTDVNGKEVDGSPFVTDDKGIFTTGKLLPGTYTVEELIPEDSVYVCKSTNPQTVTVKAGETAKVQFTNALLPGEIVVEKVSLEGKPLAGAKFSLEWSKDGTVWSPVSYTNKNDLAMGTCTTPNMESGCLITPDNGVIRWTGLNPLAKYRLTELEAPNGYIILKEAAYEGELPKDDLKLNITVINCPTFTLPKTGSAGAAMVALGQVVCGFVSVLLIAESKRKKN